MPVNASLSWHLFGSKEQYTRRGRARLGLAWRGQARLGKARSFYEGGAKTNNEHTVRAIIKNGIEWFAARDVCEVLDIQDVSSALRDFPAKEADTHTMLVRSINGSVQNRTVSIA